jgi:hypothetical protein
MRERDELRDEVERLKGELAAATGERNLGTGGPLGVTVAQSDHGDVHNIIVCRTNGDSVTITEYRRVFRAVTGHELSEVGIPSEWFAPEDRV